MNLRIVLSLLFCLALPATLPAQSRNLDIYWIDVEGGAATLIVTPSGQSLLVDTGNGTPDDRDAKRIDAAARQAGLKKIDYLLTTHFDSDHVGGMAALAKMIPIDRFFDHGDSVEKEARGGAQLWETYTMVAAGKRTTLKPATNCHCRDWMPSSSLQTGRPWHRPSMEAVPMRSARARSRNPPTRP